MLSLHRVRIVDRILCDGLILGGQSSIARIAAGGAHY